MANLVVCGNGAKVTILGGTFFPSHWGAIGGRDPLCCEAHWHFEETGEVDRWKLKESEGGDHEVGLV